MHWLPGPDAMQAEFAADVHCTHFIIVPQTSAPPGVPLQSASVTHTSVQRACGPLLSQTGAPGLQSSLLTHGGTTTIVGAFGVTPLPDGNRIGPELTPPTGVAVVVLCSGSSPYARSSILT